MKQREKEILDGLIISDGCLYCPYQNSRISFSLKYKDFAQAIAKSLPSIDWADILESVIFDKRTNKGYDRKSLRSRVHPYLTTQYHRWYKSGKKIVPRDLKVTEVMLLWWYLGDGCLVKKKSRPNHRRVALATNSFSDEDREFLISLLIKLLGTENSIYSESRTIIIGRDALCKMASILKSKNPASCYDYKFDFGQYNNTNYLKDSYKDRPLVKINAYRKKHKVREFDLALLED